MFMATMATRMIEPTLPQHPHPSDASNERGLSDAAALKKLLAWLSPAFPVGGFSYSHGLEWAIEDGTVTAAADLKAWLADILRHGSGWSDGVLFSHTYKAALSVELTRIEEISALGIAFQPSRERHLETTAQGRAFLSTVSATWPNKHLTSLAQLFASVAQIAYPVAVALACAAHRIPLLPSLNAYLGAFAASLISAAVRAVPLGQTDGQIVTAAISPLIETVANEASTATLDMLGGCAWRADIASMKHETQYTRLFRS